MTVTSRKLAAGSALNVANMVATALISVMIMPFIVHHLGDRMYGIWALVAAIAGYYGLLELGLSAAIRRYLGASLGAGDEAQSRRVFNTAFMLYCGLGGIVFVLTTAIAAAASVFTHTTEDAYLFRQVIFWVGLSVAIGFPIRVYSGVLQAHLRFDVAGLFDILSVLARTALIIPALLAGYKVIALAIISVIGNVVSAWLYISFAHRRLPYLNIDRKYCKRDTISSLFSYSVFSLAAQIADILRFQVDSVVVATFLGLALVTHYSIAGRLAQYYMGLMQAFIGVFATIFSRQEGAQDYDRMQRTFFFATKLSLCGSSFMAFGLLAWGKPFILRWMGQAYLDSYPPLVALVIGYMFALWQVPSVHLLFGISKHKYFAAANWIEGAVNLALSIWLAKKIGILGVAVGTLIPIAISKLLVQPVYVCRAAGFPFRKYLATVGRTLGVVAIALIVPMIATLRFAAPDYKILFTLGAFTAACFIPVVFRFVFAPEERMVLWRVVHPQSTLKVEVAERA
jgi:O-antigen/teichoic acid export membrane protein